MKACLVGLAAVMILAWGGHPSTEAQETAEFFQAFATATSQYEQGRSREAAATLQTLADKLRTSPWQELAALKAAELQESFDRAAAKKNYGLVWARLKDRPGDRLAQALTALARRGLQRVETEEILLALKRYYLDKVEYPPSLESLVRGGYLSEDQIRDVDGRVYPYTTGAEKLIPSVPRQTFTLEQPPLPPFGWKGARIVALSAQTAVIQWADAPSRSVRIGERVDEWEVFSVVDNGVILGNDARLVILSSR